MGRFTSLRRDSVSHMNYQSDYLGTLDSAHAYMHIDISCLILRSLT